MRRKTFFKRALTHFSRWNRKAWSAFASMHREIKICVLSVSMSIISSATLTGANKNDVAEVDSTVNHILEKSHVTSARAVRTRSSVPQTILYRRTRNEAAAVQSYEAALRLLPAVDVRERSCQIFQTLFHRNCIDMIIFVQIMVICHIDIVWIK